MATHSVLAIDWSGAAGTGRSHTWLALAAECGNLTQLDVVQDRRQLTNRLLGLRHEVVAIGLDFAFSFPVWFVQTLGVRSATEVWSLVAIHGESWLAACPPPFWGRRGHPRPVINGQAFRRTEIAAPRIGGIGPKSVFQTGGAGSVGTGSIRGMPLLARLAEAGATVWPFTYGDGPAVVEIYPRLLTGAVRKSDPLARERYLSERYPCLSDDFRRAAINSDDAFDAAVSALVMIEHVGDLTSLPEEPDSVLRLEGRIWHPCWRDDLP